MSNKLFTEKEIALLSKNQYIKNISEKAITYTDEFKRIFIAEYDKGKLPRAIFEESGLNVELVGLHRIEAASKRWRSAYKAGGALGLSDTRKGNSGRPSDKELTIEEKYERLKLQNNYLKAENELLKKIELEERRLSKKK
jgi:transposase-like protein